LLRPIAVDPVLDRDEHRTLVKLRAKVFDDRRHPPKDGFIRCVLGHVSPRRGNHYARKLTNSEFTRSACVHKTPCGPPGSSTNLTFLIIFACRRDVASGGRMRSASPCRMRVGTSLRGISVRKSSIHESTQASKPIADAPAPTFQLSRSTYSLTSFPPVTS